MRKTLSLLWLAVMLSFACAKSPAGPKSDGDPYAVVGATFAPGLYPAMAEVTRYVRYSRADGSPHAHPTDSLTNRYINWTTSCDDLFTGSGFVTDNVITVEWVVRDSARVDTLARYVTVPLDPLSSPIPGWGDTPDHMVRWSLRIDSLTPQVPLTAAFVASTMPGFSFTDPSKTVPQAAYCAQP